MAAKTYQLYAAVTSVKPEFLLHSDRFKKTGEQISAFLKVVVRDRCVDLQSMTLLRSMAQMLRRF